MGYESTLIIGTRYSSTIRDPEGIGVRTVATLDLSKAGDGAFRRLLSREQGIVKRGDASRYWVFEGPIGDSEPTGNVKVTGDRYGDPLVALPLDEVISAIEHDNRLDPYRRFDAALALLRAFDNESWRGYDEAVVLHYGH